MDGLDVLKLKKGSDKLSIGHTHVVRNFYGTTRTLRNRKISDYWISREHITWFLFQLYNDHQQNVVEMFKKGLWLKDFHIMIVRILAITMFFSQPNHEGILSTYDAVMLFFDVL